MPRWRGLRKNDEQAVAKALVIMASIPLSMIGIMPGFAATGVYFSATSMIGVIALAGIVVKNSIVLLEFILDKKQEGMPIEQALVEK